MAAAHFAVARAFDLGGLSATVQGARARDAFDRMALARASATLAASHRATTVRVLREIGAGPEAVAPWLRTRAEAVARAESQLGRIAGPDMTVVRATVAASTLFDLAADAPGASLRVTPASPC